VVVTPPAGSQHGVQHGRGGLADLRVVEAEVWHAVRQTVGAHEAVVHAEDFDIGCAGALD